MNLLFLSIFLLAFTVENSNISPIMFPTYACLWYIYHPDLIDSLNFSTEKVHMKLLNLQ